MTDCRTAYPTFSHSRPKVCCVACGVICCNGCLRFGTNVCVPCAKPVTVPTNSWGA